MKRLVWLGDSLERLREFPADARRETGYQLERVQAGFMPADWKPMPSVGLGVNEVRVRAGGASRVSEEDTEDGSGRHRVGARPVRDAGEGEKAMGRKLKVTRGTGNVFADLGFEKAEAENLKLRAELMMRIEEFCRKSGMTQAQAAEALGLTQPRLNALLKGRIGLFSLDALVNVANRAGLSVRLVVRKAA